MSTSKKKSAKKAPLRVVASQPASAPSARTQAGRDAIDTACASAFKKLPAQVSTKEVATATGLDLPIVRKSLERLGYKGTGNRRSFLWLNPNKC